MLGPRKNCRPMVSAREKQRKCGFLSDNSCTGVIDDAVSKYLKCCIKQLTIQNCVLHVCLKILKTLNEYH